MENIDEKLVVKMYREDCLSMVQISEITRISTSKIDRILRNNNVIKRNISEAITQLNITKFKKIPFRPMEILSTDEKDLKITGIMLYWGEGAKTGNCVKLANSNPGIIKVFLLFLRKICGIDEKRIKMILHIYPDQDRNFLESFWSSITGIELERFYKSHLLQGKKGTYKNKSLYGTTTISYGDKKLLKLILAWIGEYKEIFLHLPE
jgi:hypothetical protein